jgi:uncharacterized protein YecE (DUF72 family)
MAMPKQTRNQTQGGREADVYIGCSGWNYASWRGAFYPARLPPSQWLSHYARHFGTVEINNSFYRLPEESTFASWREQVPQSFVFAVKASRFLTHLKRLQDPAEPIARLFLRASGLRSKLGPVLYQLPPNLPVDLERLEGFLAALPRGTPHVVEFRNPAWYVGETFALLEQYGAALCLHDKAGSEIFEPLVGPIMYVRFHGTSGHYHGGYADKALARWAHRLADTAGAGRDVYAYFNNDPNAMAARNAATLQVHTSRLRSGRRASSSFGS